MNEINIELSRRVARVAERLIQNCLEDKYKLFRLTQTANSFDELPLRYRKMIEKAELDISDSR